LEGHVAISSPGIGSNLDVNGIVAKLMTVEAQPLTSMEKKINSYNAKISALGSLSGAVGAFQGTLSGLSTLSTFQTNSAMSNNTDILVGSATSKAVAGTYKINVTQIAQAQTLASSGVASSTAAIGVGTPTVLSFQLGTLSGGSFGMTGTALAGAVASGGIANGSLSINGTAIATDSSTRSAKALAEAINAKVGTTGVSATAGATATSATLFGSGGVSTFGDIDTSGTGTYALSVGGVSLATQADGIAAGAGVTAASLDTTLGGSNATTNALTAAGITWTGTAAAGTLQFHAADGSNLTVTETVTGTVNGGIGKDALTANAGSSVTATATVALSSSSSSPITIGGSDPTLAGFTAGTGGSYTGASFTQDPNQVSGTVTIDSTNNSLQGIRDAINKANLGVTATIVSDGSATPNHLVLTSTKTGAASTMKIAVSGSGGGPVDPAIEALLAYDPAGVQNMTQNSAAQSTKLTVNGIAVSSETTSVSEAIQGVSLTIGTVGNANLTVSKDTTAVKNAVNSFVKAYNDLNKAIKDLSGYDAENKKAGPLLGDSTVQTLQSQVRKQLSQVVTGVSSSFNSLSAVGISFQKDGTLTVDSGKLQKAIDSSFNDIAGVFAAVGKASDSLVSFTSSTTKTKPGDYTLNVTQLATQGKVTSDAALPGTVTIAADTQWAVTLDQTDPATASRTATVSLAAGSYTPAQFATLLQSAINGAGTFATDGLTASATVGGDGKLTVNSSKYGSVSKISISSMSGTAVADLFGSATSTDGVDVAGTIGGSAAKGSGKVLTADAGSDAEGLKITIDGGALGDRGTVGFSQGYAYQLNNLASTFLGSEGLFKSRTEGLNASIKDINKRKEDFNERLADIEKRYRAQYTALDRTISSLTTTQSYLTQQFAALSKQSS
jgi:flagellar hook-associated protein 2